MTTSAAISPTQEDAWKARGYWLSQGADEKPVVEGDAGQFYLDAVANDAEAPILMEKLRQENPSEYDRYREDARDDGIDLDASQDVFVHGKPVGWV